MSDRDQGLQIWTGGTWKHNKIDRNELQTRTNSQKGTGTKMAEKLNNLEKFERKKSNFSPVLNQETS